MWGDNSQSTIAYMTAIKTASANSAKSDHGRTSRIYFDNAGDTVTLMSQKPC